MSDSQIKSLNILKTSKAIENIKYPAIFLFNLVSHVQDFNDYELSIILRLFMKSHSTFMMEYNVKLIFLNTINIYSLSWCSLTDFYKIIGKKLSLVFVLKKFHMVYNNNVFWMMKTSDQIDYLANAKERFLSIYDCSKGGMLFYHKLAQLFKDNKHDKTEIQNDIINRLIYILEIFGQNVLVSLEIPLISVTDFCNLSDENILKYLIVIYEKCTELLNQTIKLFDSYNLVCLQLANLVNPSLIKIKSSNIDSETEDDDIKLICVK